MNTYQQLHELASEPLIAEKLPQDLLERIRKVDAADTMEIEQIMRELLVELERIIPLLSAEEDAAFEDLSSKVNTLETSLARQQATLDRLHGQEAELRSGLQQIGDNLQQAEEL